MKSFVKKSAIVLPLIVCSLAGLSSCTKERRAFAFVAVNSGEWDQEITIGDWKYKFRGNLLDNHDVIFKATTTGRKSQAGGPGGPGGGFPGGGFPGGAPFGAQGGQVETPTEPTPEELKEKDFEFKGTWKEEKGYGYILTMADKDKTVIHADFVKTEGRHQFYYNVTNKDNVSETVFFQAKDPTYKDRLADDYEVWDKRDSKYVYKAKGTGNNGSLAYAYLYLHNDGSVVENTPKDRSASRTVVIGKTWKEDNGIITVKDGDKTYTSKKCIDSSIDASMIALPNYTYLVSNTKSFKWTKLTPEHFDVKATYKFKGEVSQMFGGNVEVTLFLNPEGKCKYYEGNSFTPKKEGTWTEENKVITITLGTDAPVTSTLLDDGSRQIVLVSESKTPWGSVSKTETQLVEYK